MRKPVVLDVAPPLTVRESYAALSAVTPDFEELNTADALANARIGADLAAPTWDGVVEAADDIDAAVIVIGSRGLIGAQELLKGSLSHDVAEHAGRPVLIVPPRHGDGSR